MMKIDKFYIWGEFNCNLLREKQFFRLHLKELVKLVIELYQLTNHTSEPIRITLISTSLVDHILSTYSCMQFVCSKKFFPSPQSTPRPYFL